MKTIAAIGMATVSVTWAVWAYSDYAQSETAAIDDNQPLRQAYANESATLGDNDAPHLQATDQPVTEGTGLEEVGLPCGAFDTTPATLCSEQATRSWAEAQCEKDEAAAMAVAATAGAKLEASGLTPITRADGTSSEEPLVVAYG